MITKTALSKELLEKIARNVNAMDIYYYYSDDAKKNRYWGGIYGRIAKVTKQLTEVDKIALLPLCNESNAKFFNLI